MKKEILRMEHILCQNGEVPVLNYLSMQIFKGEIYGILCLEQYGIEKMLDLICRNSPIQNGQVFFKEELVNSVEGSSETRNPVALIGRKCRLIEELTLADNLFVIREGFRRFVVPDRVIQAETKRVLGEMDVNLSPKTLVKELRTYERLVAEVLRAVIVGSPLIILWEISDLLSAEELPRFHHFIRRLAQKGHTFLYVYSHHEVLRLVCDRVAVFKGGTIQKVFNGPDTIKEHITNVYARNTYEKLLQIYVNEADPKMDEVVLKLDHVRGKDIRELDFCVHRGENVILLDQNNTILNELMELLRGEELPVSGRITPDIRIPGNRRRIAFVRQNATGSTLFPEMSYLDNLCFPLAEKVPFFWQKHALPRSVYRECREELGPVMDAANLYQLDKKELYTLVYYRYMLARPDLLVCLQPLSDMDMHLRLHILGLLVKLRNKGIAVLNLSTELYDTLQIADRLIQVEQGSVIAEHARQHFEEARMTGKEIFPD